MKIDRLHNESNYEFTQDWFKNSEPEIIKYIDFNKKIDILEIGSYEGFSSCYFSDNFLLHEDSRLHCVDPYFTSEMDASIEKRFHANIIKSKEYNKISVFRQTSDKFFKNNNLQYDLIYVDGSNHPSQISMDLQNAFDSLRENGILWANHRGKLDLDSQRLSEFEDHAIFTRNVINNFLNKSKGLYEQLFKRNQLAIKKNA